MEVKVEVESGKFREWFIKQLCFHRQGEALIMHEMVTGNPMFMCPLCSKTYHVTDNVVTRYFKELQEKNGNTIS